MVSVVMSLLSYVILFIWDLSHFSLVHLAKNLNFVYLIKEWLLVSLIFSTVP